MGSWERRLAIAAVALLTFFPLLHTRFTTGDDIRTALYAISSFRELWDFTWNEMKVGGRFFYFLLYPMGTIPFRVDHPLYCFTLLVTPILVNVWLFSRLVTQACGSRALGWLVATLCLLGMQNSWERNMLSGSPFLHTVMFNFTLLSILFYQRSRDAANAGDSVGAARIARFSGILFFISLLTSESFLFYFFFFPFFWGLEHKWSRGVRDLKDLKEMLRALRPQLTAAATYVACYLGFRLFFPGGYEGTRPGGGTIAGYFGVLWQYSVASLPGSIFSDISYARTFREFTDSIHGHQGTLWQLISEAKVQWWVRAALSVSLAHSALKWASEKGDPSATRKQLPAVLAASAWLFFSPNLLLGLSKKYQDWVAEGSIGYVHTYFSTFGAALAMAITMLWIQARLPSGWPKRIGAAGIILAVAGMSLVTDYSNFHISKSQKLSQLKWTTVNALLESDAYRKIPDHSLILAPSLWKSLFHAKTNLRYWTDYFQKKTGKIVMVIPDPEMLLRIRGQLGSAIQETFYLHFAQEEREPDQFILLARLKKISRSKDSWTLEADAGELIGYSRNHRFLIQGRARGERICIEGRPYSLSPDGRFTFAAGFESKAPERLARLPVVHFTSEQGFDPTSLMVSYYPYRIRSSLSEGQCPPSPLNAPRAIPSANANGFQSTR